MKDPRRLIEHGATDEELALLRAADTDEPSEDAPMRLAALLGVSAHVTALRCSGRAIDSQFVTKRAQSVFLALRGLDFSQTCILFSSASTSIRG